LYRNKINIPRNTQKEAEAIIDRRFWIDRANFDMLFVNDGYVTDGMDTEMKLINNAIIDGISNVINDAYDALFEIRIKNEKADD
jgi:hypothetical protein